MTLTNTQNNPIPRLHIWHVHYFGSAACLAFQMPKNSKPRAALIHLIFGGGVTFGVQCIFMVQKLPLDLLSSFEMNSTTHLFLLFLLVFPASAELFGTHNHLFGNFSHLSFTSLSLQVFDILTFIGPLVCVCLYTGLFSTGSKGSIVLSSYAHQNQFVFLYSFTPPHRSQILHAKGFSVTDVRIFRCLLLKSLLAFWLHTHLMANLFTRIGFVWMPGTLL